MPIRVYHRTLDAVVLCFQYFELSIPLNQGGTMRTTHMENKCVRVSTIRRMAIHTHARHLGIFDNGSFFKGSQFAFVESHVTVYLISRSNSSVSQSVIFQYIGTNLHLKILVAVPLAFLLDAYRESKLSSLVGLEQLVPVFHVEGCILSLHMQFSLLASFDYHIHTLCFFLRIKVQGSDTDRDGNTDIIGVDRRHFIYLDCIFDFLLASTHHRCQEDEYPFVHSLFLH